ncbi:unnamed protein product [Cladocopium goreaui]|uniref:Uncharacterized protein n=1 Tax=Cladocopium goreaui TaxID=2562237 RepID=A0A9P1G2T4_9DINO|nr:unnamed protein product [Cladocopium goreaui]
MDTPRKPVPKASPTPVIPTVAKGGHEKDSLYWKLRRHCVIKKGECSKAALDLWKTKDGRAKLKELMIKNGMDFGNVEVALKRQQRTSIGHRRQGRKMADSSFEWASKQNLIRTNPMHGEQEAKLILEDGFTYDHVQDEDQHGNFLSDELPTGSGLDLLKMDTHDGDGTTPEDHAAACSGSFKLTFPTIQENASALTVLPHWIEVCGRKIDNTAAVLDWAGVSSALCIFDITSMLIAKQIGIQVNHMKTIYEKLEGLQGDLAATRTSRPETQKNILKLCAEATKTDVALNNLVVRSRSLKGAPRSSTKPGSSGAKPPGSKPKDSSPAAYCIGPRSEDETDSDLADELLVGLEEDWIDTIFNYGGHFLLGGRSLDHIDSFKNELFTFWSNYKVIDPELPFFERGGADEDSWSCTIPLAIHGDEGHSLCTRLLYAILPSPYTKQSFHRLLSVLKDDLNKLEDDGDWWDVKGAVKTLPPEASHPSPFKAGDRSPLRDLHLGDSTKYIKIDPAHTFAIDGIGKDFLASSIIMLARAGHFGNGPITYCWQNAYANFIAYCNAYKKSTSISEFSFSTFKLNAFPRGLGKGHDAAEGRFKDILAVIKTSICANDRFWRAIYAHGIWIPRLVAEQIVKDGWVFNFGGIGSEAWILRLPG